MTLIITKCYESTFLKVGDSLNIENCENVDSFIGLPNIDSFIGLKDGNGDWTLLENTSLKWVIVDVPEENISLHNEEECCSFREGTIVFTGSSKELSASSLYKKFNLDSSSSFFWAYYIGNEDVMLSNINDQNSAYLWAKWIGNHDLMIDKIKYPHLAISWAIQFGNEDVMKKVVESAKEEHWIVEWNKYFPENQIQEV